MAARLHREFRQTVKAIDEQQLKEADWLMDSYEEREAAGEFKTNPIQYRPEDFGPQNPSASPDVRPTPGPETYRDPIDFVEKPIK